MKTNGNMITDSIMLIFDSFKLLDHCKESCGNNVSAEIESVSGKKKLSENGVK